MSEPKLIINKETGEVTFGDIHVYPGLDAEKFSLQIPGTSVSFSYGTRTASLLRRIPVNDLFSFKNFYSFGSPFTIDSIYIDTLPGSKTIRPDQKFEYAKKFLKELLGEPDIETEYTVIYVYPWGEVRSILYFDRRNSMQGGDIAIEYTPGNQETN